MIEQQYCNEFLAAARLYLLGLTSSWI